jgi:hypothetical protein
MGSIESIITCFHELKIYLGMFYSNRDPIVKIEMGKACSAYGEKKSTGILWENLRERDHLHDPGVDGRIN